MSAAELPLIIVSAETMDDNSDRAQTIIIVGNVAVL